jgi:hypothetical protein
MNEIEKLAFALQHFAGLEEYDFQPSLVVCLVGHSHLLPEYWFALSEVHFCTPKSWFAVGNSHLFP